MSEEKIPTLAEATAEADKCEKEAEADKCEKEAEADKCEKEATVQQDGEKLPELGEIAAASEEPGGLIPELSVEKKPVYLLKFTLDGEVLVEKRNDKVYAHPLKDVELLPLSKAFTETHMSEIKMFHSLVRTVRKNYPKREVPVTRKELFRSGASPKVIQQLCEMGFLRETLVDFVNKEGKNTGARACFFYTPQGRALIRAKLDPSYAKTGYN